MPQSSDPTDPWKAPPKDWAEEQAHRVAQAVRRLRGKHSAQWLADRTGQLGYAVSRSVISDLEIGRRRYVTTAELIVLASALNTAPIALLYPGPDYRKEIEVIPNFDAPEIWGVQWFSGMVDSISDVPFADDGRLIEIPSLHENRRGLDRARQMFELDERKNVLRKDLRIARAGGASDGEISEYIDAIADIQRRIDELGELGGGPIRDVTSWGFRAEELAQEIRKRRTSESGGQDGG